MAEVMHHPTMMEEEEPQLVHRTKNIHDDITTRSSVESGVSDITDVASEEVENFINNGKTQNNVYLDKNEGFKIELSDSGKDLKAENSVINDQNGGSSHGEIVSGFSIPTLEQPSTRANETAMTDLEEESDEEVIEMEFERAAEKVHTHTAFCPNCNSQITKVILRRKIRGTRSRSHVDNRQQDKPANLFGCLSCFSIFIPSGNCLNSFSLFGNKGKNDSIPTVDEAHALGASVPASSGSTDVNGNKVKQGSVFDLFWNFGKGKGDTISDNSQGNDQVNTGKGNNEASSPHYYLAGTHLGSEARVPLLHGTTHASASNVTDESKKPVQLPEVSPIFESLPVSAVVLDIEEGIDSISEGLPPPRQIEINEKPSAKPRQPRVGEREITVNGSKLWEILKCIVYGGLIELITSFGVVTSADSSGATKLNIIALGIANVISGLFVLGHNLVDLKNEESKYQEILGRRNHFLLHATFAILSYLLFGFMPSVAYGYTEFWIVAAASFGCIVVLAIAKAYVSQTQTFLGYVKTLSYYIIMAVTVSGLAYVVGDQLKKFMEEGGWFDPSAAFPPPVAPDTYLTTQAWSSL